MLTHKSSGKHPARPTNDFRIKTALERLGHVMCYPVAAINGEGLMDQQGRFFERKKITETFTLIFLRARLWQDSGLLIGQ